jgi:hypothetical protein
MTREYDARSGADGCYPGDGNPIFRPAPTRACTGRRRPPIRGAATNEVRTTKADGLEGRQQATHARCRGRAVAEKGGRELARS